MLSYFSSGAIKMEKVPQARCSGGAREKSMEQKLSRRMKSFHGLSRVNLGFTPSVPRIDSRSTTMMTKLKRLLKMNKGISGEPYIHSTIRYNHMKGHVCDGSTSERYDGGK